MNGIKMFFKELANFINGFAEFTIPLLVKYSTPILWFATTIFIYVMEFTITTVIILTLVMIIICRFIEYYNKNEKDKKLSELKKYKRYTIETNDGVSIRKSDWNEAILYLSMLEDYMNK